MILDILFGNGDDSEVDGLSEEEGNNVSNVSSLNSFIDQTPIKTFLNICSETTVEDDVDMELNEEIFLDTANTLPNPVLNNDVFENPNNEDAKITDRPTTIAGDSSFPLSQASKEHHTVGLNLPSCSKQSTEKHSHTKRVRSPKSAIDTRPKKKQNLSVPKSIRNKNKRNPLVWEKKKFQCNIPAIDTRNNDENLDNSILTPLEYFTAYYPDTYFENTALYTNMYSLNKLGRNVNTDSAEIKKLYGMHLMMGCISYPRMRMYWASGIELKPISNAMPRNRFFYLRNSLHVVDINDPPINRNRLWKVQPVLDSVKAGLDKIERVPGNYSIDEQMIPFTGRTTLKQFVPNKPRPVGLKNFVVTTSSGILLDFEVYQGESTNLPMKKDVGLGPSVVLRLKDTLPPLSVLYFDRYFTSLQLMEHLASESYFGTGTLMMNRLQELTFCPNKDLKRGEFEELTSNDGRFVAIKWMDNQSVIMLSSVCGSEPVTLVKRWSKKDSIFINVECPAAIVTYNKNMGGVDLFNQQMEVYRTWFKTRKWTLKVILHFLDLAVVNSWFQYKTQCEMANKKRREIMDLLKFRMDLSYTLMNQPRRGRPDYSDEEEQQEDKKQNWRAPIPVLSKRTDCYDHFPIVDDLKTARSCRLEGCKSRSRVRCEKCNVYLCLTKSNNCFMKFHK